MRLEATQVWEDAVSGELGETSEALAFLVVEGTLRKQPTTHTVTAERVSELA